MEAFLCAVALCIVVAVSEVLQPYKQGFGVTRGGPRGGACLMMMEWRFLLPFCFLQVTMGLVVPRLGFTVGAFVVGVAGIVWIDVLDTLVVTVKI